MKDRIQKVLAAAGVASRRAIEEMVLQGRIAVNGRVMQSLPVMVDPERDKITVDDEPIRIADHSADRRIYILMYKPKGIFSTNVAQGEQTRAIDLLPPNFPFRVFPVGRLDAESKGLLLLTNDGELTNKLTHPRYGVSKTYRAVIDGTITPADVKELEDGVWLADPVKGGFRTGRSRIKIVKRGRDRSTVDITIREGRNRQVRRMLARIGHKVRELTRVKMGPLDLKGLAMGEFRELTSRELKALYASTKPREEAKPDARPVKPETVHTRNPKREIPRRRAKR